MKRETYVIVINRPDGVTVERMNYYIKEAVSCWSGQFESNDPLFDWFNKRGNAVHVARRNIDEEVQKEVAEVIASAIASDIKD